MRLCGAAGVGCEVSKGKKNIQTYPYSNCTFHHQSSQRKQTSQHNLLYVYLSACWKTGQKPCKNTHGENCSAQVGCWYFVRLCGAAGAGGEVSDEKNNPSTSILTALFITRIHKEKQI